MNHPFLKPRIIYKATILIAARREALVQDLVAYAKDEVRYRRRMNMLVHLSEYEQALLRKINDFETTNDDDLGEAIIKTIGEEVRQITNLDA